MWSFDFRGHGDCDPSPDGAYAWTEFADDAEAVLDHLELRGDPRLLAVGHSKGAASLLAVAARRPDAIPRVWGYEPIVFPSDDPISDDADNPMSNAARRRRGVWPSREDAASCVRVEAAAQRARRGGADGVRRLRDARPP